MTIDLKEIVKVLLHTLLYYKNISIQCIYYGVVDNYLQFKYHFTSTSQSSAFHSLKFLQKMIVCVHVVTWQSFYPHYQVERK